MRNAFLVICVVVFVALPVSAANNVLYRGVDLWDTVDDGSTYLNFGREPIPAGFFCSGSEPFTDRVGLRGVRVATGNDGELGSTDTIVERLDDAVFNKSGVAYTRIRVRALQLESIAPIKTACGSFILRVQLDGAQPVTRMRIVRDNKFGGRFRAPIAIHSKLSFVPVSGPVVRPLEISHTVDFPGNSRVPWTFNPGWRGVEKKGSILVDTNFDGQPDTFVPGTSNFAGGWQGARNKASSDCHLEPPEDCGHCVGPAVFVAEQ